MGRIDSDAIQKSIALLVACKSFAGEKEEIKRFQELLEELFYPTFGSAIWIPLDGGLFILRFRKRKDAKRRVLFVCHADVAKGAKECSLHVEGDKLFGPGAADMKGGIALLLHAIRYFEESSESPTIGVDIAIVPDEESGSLASKESLKEIAKEADACFVLEPCYEDGSFVSTRSGSLTLKFTFLGVARHVGRSKEREGHALYAAAKLTLFIEEMMEQDLHTNVGILKGGDEANSTASNAELIANFRPQSERALEELKGRLKEKLSELERETKCSIHMETLSERPPKKASPKLEALLHRLCNELEIPFQLRHSNGVTDGNTIASLGIPTIDTLGVQGGGLHSKGEFLYISDLKKRCKLLVSLLTALQKGAL